MMFVSSRKTGLIVCFSLIGYTASAFSASLNPAERNETQQRQSEVIEQSRQQREALQQLNNIVQAPLKADNALQGPCFTLREIRFNHSTLLGQRDQTALTAGYLNRCNNLQQINQLMHDVSNWYIQRGYITSRAFLSEQDLSGGVLQLEILEGRLEKITINNQTERMTRTAFPAREGEILNLRDIEQGMEQMNRMPSQQVTIEILPGSQPGYSVVNLTREAHLPFTGGVTFDNSGQKSTGEQQLNGSLALDNLFGVADQWFISAATVAVLPPATMRKACRPVSPCRMVTGTWVTATPKAVIAIRSSAAIFPGIPPATAIPIGYRCPAWCSATAP